MLASYCHPGRRRRIHNPYGETVLWHNRGAYPLRVSFAPEYGRLLRSYGSGAVRRPRRTRHCVSGPLGAAGTFTVKKSRCHPERFRRRGRQISGMTVSLRPIVILSDSEGSVSRAAPFRRLSVGKWPLVCCGGARARILRSAFNDTASEQCCLAQVSPLDGGTPPHPRRKRPGLSRGGARRDGPSPCGVRAEPSLQPRLHPPSFVPDVGAARRPRSTGDYARWRFS
jgi:hypothetical protein